MYKFSYTEVLEHSPESDRQNERRAIDHSIELLRRAEAAGPESREASEAYYFVSRLWSILLEDLGKPENDLPQEIKAQIISIGIWILKELEAIRSGERQGFSGLIVVSESIAEGLK